jgi:hypothetical protein
MPTSAWVINLVVLAAVLLGDLGHRKINAFRLVRPVIVTAVIIAFYVKSVATNGNGLAFEIGLAALGIVLGVVASALFQVRREQDGFAWSTAGTTYALLWVVVIGARLAFEDEAYTSHALDRWFATNSLSSNAITDALIFMAITMVLTRTAGLRVRAILSSHRPPTPSVAENTT